MSETKPEESATESLEKSFDVGNDEVRKNIMAKRRSRSGT